MLAEHIYLPNHLWFGNIPAYFSQQHSVIIKNKSLLEDLGFTGPNDQYVWDFIKENVADDQVLSIITSEIPPTISGDVYVLNSTIIKDKPEMLTGTDWREFILTYAQENGDYFFADYGVLLFLDLKELVILDKTGRYFCLTENYISSKMLDLTRG